MTTCERVRERLPEHVLGTLDETDDLAVRRHLRGCAGCRPRWARSDEGLALVRARRPRRATPPPELQDRVLTSWPTSGATPPRAEARPARRSGRRVRWLARRGGGRGARRSRSAGACREHRQRDAARRGRRQLRHGCCRSWGARSSGRDRCNPRRAHRRGQRRGLRLARAINRG